MANPLDMSIIKIETLPTLDDFGFTEDPESALTHLRGRQVYPAVWYEIRRCLSLWYEWFCHQHPEQSGTHYWLVEIRGPTIDAELHKPLYQHDCTRCEYLGIYDDERGLFYDLYACTRGPGPTLIARYGNEPAEYLSGRAFIDYEPAIREAARREKHQATDFFHRY